MTRDPFCEDIGSICPKQGIPGYCAFLDAVCPYRKLSDCVSHDCPTKGDEQ
jgi:hypothetical protein